ncbi:PfkB family carbohydrate kinase [Microvirga lotononidis]|uniref:Sugar kinase, ribokinase n=1 Tax=Microvirga lotononidis TaxID=864069 RepID=I4YYD5_9HYPH|nr:PfkB family carbohydrate kinase [Microvirga lotononidis]EIM28977.1 sugar kinase, ribokinase [Microvirga lotononidis]WQO26892.1 PfkB family carbohydrate kinase [Microvirga lotononidis]
MNVKPVICLGCAFWDTIFKIDHIPDHGAKVLPEKAVQAASGMATAAAATIARLGGDVEIWARIGDDPTGDSFLHDLSREAIRTDHIRRIAGARTAFSTILVDRSGERLVVPYTDPSLDADPSWLPLHRVAEAAAVLVDMRWIEGAKVLFAEAQRHGVPRILDADVAPPDELRQMITLADHVLFSEAALLSLAESRSPRDALLDVAQHLDAEIVGVTLGAAGALVWQRGAPEGTLSEFPTLPVHAVDTLNAGDVWHGTYVYGLVNGWDLPTRIRIANVAAAMKCEHFGGRLGSPRLPELFERSRTLLQETLT